jgi:4-hydroxy-tetrahydrodipicolinate synthase
VAIKHATGSIDGACELAQASDITILSGDDPLTLPLMSIGARGVVSVLGNLVPADVKRLTAAALEGRWADAQAAHRRTYRLSRELLSLDTNPIPIKTALAIRGRMAEEFRLPMCPLSPANRERLKVVLDRFFREENVA